MSPLSVAQHLDDLQQSRWLPGAQDALADSAKPHTASASVTIVDTAFAIPQLGRTRRVWIYLPPDYATSDKTYPVLYMHDGQNLFEPDESDSGKAWRIDDAITALGEELEAGSDQGLQAGDLLAGKTTEYAEGERRRKIRFFQHSGYMSLDLGAGTGQLSLNLADAVGESQLLDRAVLSTDSEEIAELGYLGGHTLGELLQAEMEATEAALTLRGRMNMTIELPRVTAHTIGQLLMMLEIATVYAGGLYGIDPLDQPGVELGKQLTYGIMGRAGFEERRKEWEATEPKAGEWVV